MAALLRHQTPAALSLSFGLWTCLGLSAAEPPPLLRLATFSADVTVPPGQGMMGGAGLSKSVADPLEAHGLVLLGAGKPVVFVAVDWCEIRNKAFERWQRALAVAAGTEPERVMVCAVHPMSYYGQGEVSADFPGLARRRRQQDLPAVKQIYITGCAGNLTAGKYNNGATTNRPALAGRLHQAMVNAWAATQRVPITGADFRVERVRLEPRDGPGFTVPDLEQTLATNWRPFQQCLAAMGLSWRRRADAGHRIEIPCLDFGVAQWLLLPGESYVEFQLAAQRMRPDSFVMVAGFGEGATGYIPTERHIAEHDGNLSDWSWVAPGSEIRLLEAIRRVLRVPESTR